MCSSDLATDQACRFADFVRFLDCHWDKLRHDGHLCPQHVLLNDPSLFNVRIDRDQLVTELPRLLEPFLDVSCLAQLRHELERYNDSYRQRLAKRWEQAYSKDGFKILEHLYGSDLEAYGYRLPVRRFEIGRAHV